jgi:hypothetical protein
MTTTRIDLLGPSIALPEGWRGVSFSFIAPPADNEKLAMPTMAAPVAFRESVTVAIEPVPKGTTPRQYHEAQLEQLKHHAKDVAVVSKTEKTHNNAPAIVVELQIGGLRGERLRQIQLITIANGEAVAAMATTIDGGTYPIAKKRLLAVLESLSF